MTPEQKSELKKRGGDFLDKNLGDLGNFLGQKPTLTETTNKFS
jgi:hypothetical protein